MLRSSSFSMALPQRSCRLCKSQRAARVRRLVAILFGLHVSVLAAVAAADGTVVTYSTPDGFRVLADYYRPETASDRAVVILPDPKEGREPWGPIADSLRARGYHVLVPDLRGAGESQFQRGIRHDRHHFSEGELAAASIDGQSAVRYLRNLPGSTVRRVAMIGSGEGAPSVLAVPSRGLDGFARILVSPLPAVVARPIPPDPNGSPSLLIIVGGDDVLGIEAAAGLIPNDSTKECWLLDGPGRGSDLLRARIDLFPALLARIDRSLGLAP